MTIKTRMEVLRNNFLRMPYFLKILSIITLIAGMLLLISFIYPGQIGIRGAIHGIAFLICGYFILSKFPRAREVYIVLPTILVVMDWFINARGLNALSFFTQVFIMDLFLIWYLFYKRTVINYFTS